MMQHPEQPDTQQSAYLWDGTGPVDLEIATLERTLRPLRHQPGAISWGKRTPRRGAWAFLGAAAVACLALFLVWQPTPAPPVSSWAIAGQEAERAIRSGEVLATGNDMSLRLHSAEVGSLTIEPNSRVRVLPPAHRGERLSLEYGTLRAFIWAPPAKFAVETPSALAVDLGCVYTLQTDRRGNGELTVEVGWVALQKGGTEAFIPAGARCRLRKDRGPGLPVYSDAPEALQQGVARFEDHGQPLAAGALALARPKDAFTLWHLIPRTRGSEREAVVARFRELVELPEAMTQEDLLAAHSQTMDTAWEALQLGSSQWWRTWRQEW
jgi:hypothetical protein